MKNKSKSDQFDKLRKHAETLLQKDNIPHVPPDDINKIIEELHIHQIELELQNEELRRSQSELEESHTKYLELFDFAPVGYFSTDRNGKILESNLAGADLLGTERRNLVNWSLSRFVASDFKPVFLSHQEHVLAEAGSSQTCELKLMKKDDTSFFALIKSTAMKDSAGNFTRILTAVTDITERKQAEERDRKALEEKTVLVREIHHRVKNNLAVLTGLINMQMDTVSAPEALKELASLKGRTVSMALVHDILYNSDNMAQINIRQYLEKLVYSQFSALDGKGRRISVHVDADYDETISIEIAIPCGLVINEIITNSLKYAFPPELEKSDCEIRVSFELQGKECILRVSDNGKGIPGEIDWRNVKSVGLNLVKNLAEYQLDGTVELDTREGTFFTVRFLK
ncbi:MAG: PAS domain S-box protein [Desulfobacterales bacterium]|nr:PAS domain S-box protein [Desulfobacterales bacterium]